MNLSFVPSVSGVGNRYLAFLDFIDRLRDAFFSWFLFFVFLLFSSLLVSLTACPFCLSK